MLDISVFRLDYKFLKACQVDKTSCSTINETWGSKFHEIYENQQQSGIQLKEEFHNR